MSATKPLHELSIAEAGRQLRAGTLSSTALTQHALSRIASLDPLLHAFVLVTKERALADARRADRELKSGIDKGPMHGIPYALKDIYATAGIRTTCHSKLLIDNVPGRGQRGRGEVQGGRRGAARQARHARVRHRRAELRSAVPAGAQSVEPRSFHRRFVVRLGRRRRRRPRAHRPWARTRAARSAGRPSTAARSGSSRPTGWCRAAASFRSPTRSTIAARSPGRWRTRPSPCR